MEKLHCTAVGSKSQLAERDDDVNKPLASIFRVKEDIPRKNKEAGGNLDCLARRGDRHNKI